MSAVEHLKTLCCLGLPPESAMLAAIPLLHEIIPHGWTRYCLFEADARIRAAYGENPAGLPIFQERFGAFMEDQSGLASLMLPAFRSHGIGWTLHRQGGGWLDSAYYHELEAPIDSCWILDAMIGDGGPPFAGIHLTRPRGAHPFSVDEVRRLDRLRVWLAHALRPLPPDGTALSGEPLSGRAGHTGPQRRDDRNAARKPRLCDTRPRILAHGYLRRYQDFLAKKRH